MRPVVSVTGGNQVSVYGVRGPAGPAGAAGPSGPSGVGVTDTSVNLAMVCLPTSSDGDQATATALAATPYSTSSVRVEVNGVPLGPMVFGSKTSAVYFSTDGGATALDRASLTSGATIHFNGSVVGYQLDAGDRISVIYEVSS